MIAFLLTLTLTAQAQSCESLDPAAAADASLRLWLVEESLPAASACAQTALQQLPHAPAFLSVHGLAYLHQVAGALALEGGDAPEARRHMAAAVRLASTIPYDARLGREAGQLYAEARSEQSLLTPEAVTIQSAVVVDGVFVSPDERLTLTVGQHWVQWVSAEGRLHTTQVELRPNQSLRLGEPPEQHRGRSALGIGLNALGAGALVGAFYRWDGHETLPLSTQQLQSRQSGALLIAGCTAIGLGTLVITLP